MTASSWRTRSKGLLQPGLEISKCRAMRTASSDSARGTGAFDFSTSRLTSFGFSTFAIAGRHTVRHRGSRALKPRRIKLRRGIRIRPNRPTDVGIRLSIDSRPVGLEPGWLTPIRCHRRTLHALSLSLIARGDSSVSRLPETPGSRPRSHYENLRTPGSTASRTAPRDSARPGEHRPTRA